MTKIKAIAGGLAALVASATALVTYGVLPEPWNTRVAAACAVLAPLLTFAGVYHAPANESTAGMTFTPDTP